MNRENDGALVLFKNKKGPSIEPCGTPLLSALRSAVVLIFRFPSKKQITEKVFFLITEEL